MGILKKLFGNKSSTDNLGVNIGSNLSLDQKWAIVCFELSLASFAKGERERKEAQKLIDQESRMLEVNPRELLSYVEKYKKPEVIISALKTIFDKSLLDQIAYTSFGIAHICKNKDAIAYYSYSFEQLGYSEEELIELIEKVQLLGKMMGGK